MPRKRHQRLVPTGTTKGSGLEAETFI